MKVTMAYERPEEKPRLEVEDVLELETMGESKRVDGGVSRRIRSQERPLGTNLDEDGDPEQAPAVAGRIE